MSSPNLHQFALMAGIKDYLVLAAKCADDPVAKGEAEAMLKRLEENKPLAAFEQVPGAPASTY